MSPGQTAGAVLLSVGTAAATAFLVVGLSGGYMAWVFAAIWAGIAVPMSGMAIIFWHVLAARLVKPSGAAASESNSRSRGIVKALVAVFITSLLLAVVGGRVSEASVAPPVGLSLFLGGCAYVLVFAFRQEENAPSAFQVVD